MRTSTTSLWTAIAPILVRHDCVNRIINLPWRGAPSIRIDRSYCMKLRSSLFLLSSDQVAK